MFAVTMAVFLAFAVVNCGLYPGVRLHTEEEFKETFYVKLNKPNLCKDSLHPVVVLINSAAGNFNERSVLRSTWIPRLKELEVAYSFVVANADNWTMEGVIDENREHGDILVAKFMDSYFNLTLKSVFELGWTRTFCPKKWALLMDDDGILEPDNLLKYIDQLAGEWWTAQKNIRCFAGFYEVQRDGSWSGLRRYFVPKDIYEPNTWPWRCSGIGYLVSPAAVGPLHDACLDKDTKPKLWIEDVYVTAFAATKAKIKVIADHKRFVGQHVAQMLVRRQVDLDKVVVLGNAGKSEWAYRSTWDTFVEQKKEMK